MFALSSAAERWANIQFTLVAAEGLSPASRVAATITLDVRF